MDGGSTRKQQPACYHCRHFFITHEPAHPYGCRAMNFKSARQPAEVVFASSGMSCQLFERKAIKKQS